MTKIKKIYLDHAATTPTHPEVLEAMLPYYKEFFGNPSSAYTLGRKARKAVDKARADVASLIGADPLEIVFTSGGTEADNLAIRGIACAREAKGRHIITSAIEHHAVLNTCKYLEERGFSVSYLPVDGYGLVDPDDVKKAITSDTILITIMYANNEVGTIEPIKEIGLVAKKNGILFHSDAVQAVGKIPVDVATLNVDLLSVSGHKIYGPKGVGALYIKNGVEITPLLYGGGHEKNLRAGTENVPGIVGLGKACEIASRDLESQMSCLQGLRDRLQTQITEKIHRTRINGHPLKRLPHILSASFEYVDGESIIANLDLKGIDASAGAACTSGDRQPSHVLSAMRVSPDVAIGTVRFSLGRETTKEEIEYTKDILEESIKRLRGMCPLTEGTNLKRHCVVTFSDPHYALLSEKALDEKGLRFAFTSLPNQVDCPTCCNIALLFMCEDEEEITSLLKDQGIEIEGTHLLEGPSPVVRAIRLVGLKRKEMEFWSRR